MESGILIAGIAIAVWLLSTKQTRKSVGASVVETALLTEQSLKISRATAFKEAKDELEDLEEMLDASNKFLA